MTPRRWPLVFLICLAFGVVAVRAEDVGTRARFGSPPVPAAGAGVSGTLTNSGGKLVIDAGIVQVGTDQNTLGGPLTAGDPLVGTHIQARGPANSYSLDLFDSTNTKHWYFTNNNDSLIIANNAAAAMITMDNTGAWANFGSTKNRGSCTLNGGSPATCTATVTASSICVCAPVGTSAAIAAAGCAVSLSTTTLTITGANGVSTVINYHCF